MPVRVRLIMPQSRSPTNTAQGEDEDAEERVADPEDADRDALGERLGRRDLVGDAAEVAEHLVGDDDRGRDRDQRLAQLLALVPAQEELLHRRGR